MKKSKSGPTFLEICQRISENEQRNFSDTYLKIFGLVCTVVVILHLGAISPNPGALIALIIFPFAVIPLAIGIKDDYAIARESLISD